MSLPALPGLLWSVLSVLPFLPPGRGALILILGGLIVLPFSLLMSRVGAARATSAHGGGSQSILTPYYAASGPQQSMAMRERQDAHAVSDRQGWQPVAFHESPQPQARPWQGTAMERALRIAVGATQLVAATPGHYVVRLGRCDSCARRLAGCGRERGAIELAMTPYLRQVRVTETLCSQRQRRASCTFEIRGH